MSTITVNTRSFGTPTSVTADKAEDIGRIYGVKVHHQVDTDRWDRTATRHRVTLTGDRTVLEMLSADLRKIGVRPHIVEETERTPRRTRR